MITVESEFKVENIKIDIPSTVQQIAKAIKTDIENNLNTGRSFDGSAIAPKKIPNGKPIFVNTGKLLKSVTNTKISSNEYEISIGEQRHKIASFLQRGTRRMPSRKFFGVSQRIINLIDSVLTKIKVA